MSLAVGVVCLGGAAAVVYAAVAGQQPSIQPGLYPEPDRLDFGELAQGDVRDGQFRLTNRHPESIELLDTLTGCSCTQSTLSAKHLAPGESCDLGVKWSVGTRRGRLSDSVHVAYRTAAGKQHMLDLGLGANVVPDIHFAPADPTFETREPTRIVIKFTPGRRDPFRLKHAAANQAAFRTELDAARAEVTVAFDPAKWLSIGADPVLSVETDSERQPTITIPLRVTRSAVPQAMASGGS